MANTLITNDIIAKMVLMEFKNYLGLTKSVRRQYEPLYNNTTGGNIRIRKPTRYTVREGSDADIQNIEQRQTSLTVATQAGVDVSVSSYQFALELDDFNQTIIKPAALQLANYVDIALYNTTSQIYNAVGTAGSAPNSFSTISQAGAILSSYGVPETDRYLAMSPMDGSALKSALYNTFNTGFNNDIILRGSMGELSGFNVFNAQNLIRPEVSDDDIGAPQVNGGSQSGSNLIVNGLTPGVTIFAGAIFTIDGVYAVNPITRKPLTFLQQFTVTADTTASGGGAATLPISPSIVLTGPYQNVSAGPADSANLNFVETQHTINFAYHEEAFTLAMVRLPDDNQMGGAYMKTMVDNDANVSIRMVRQYQANSDTDLIRFDILFGVACFPEYACRVMGS